ncbi:MAG TPA: glutathione S-transferase family protein [Candidatus Binatia bacterium]|jgi:glutathione S-transferase
MSDLILHHYWESPYAEKIRRIFGFKKLAWRSVIIPIIMPKPDLLALTGGYRKTPVLQIGADVYCDTDLIARVLDTIAPDPPLFPDDCYGQCYMLGPWQQEFFWLCVRSAGAAAPLFPPGFLEDRATMRDNPITRDQAIADVPVHREQLRAKLDFLDTQLRGRRFVLGDRISLADFEMFHPANLLAKIAQVSPLLDPFPNIGRWLARIDELGYGDVSEMTGGEAVEAARAAAPVPGGTVDADEPNALRLGDRVEVVHESFGRDPVAGDVVSSSVHEIAIHRRDERTGDVVVHFPREHYRIRKI